MKMDKNTKNILARNVRLLMEHREMRQKQLEIKSGVNQKTISNIINPNATKNGATLENIAAVAKAFNLEAWHLLVPDQPIEVLASKSMEKLVNNYAKVDSGGRKNLDRISENEVRYCTPVKKTINGN